MTLYESISRVLVDSADSIVCIDGSRCVSRSELAADVSLVAEAISAVGVSAGQRVAICMPPSVELLVAICAVWRLGASYVPLDPSDNSTRRSKIVGESGACAILSRAEHGGVVVDVVTPVAHNVTQDGEAYVLFTSGSTGTPKGVSVSHRSVANYINHVASAYAPTDPSALYPLQLSPGFDASLTSILPPLAIGGVSVPIRHELSAVAGLGEFLSLCDREVVVKTTPSQIRLLREFIPTEALAQLKATFVVGGEQLDFADVGWLRAAGSIRIFNEYGPTEATVGCAYYCINDQDPGSGPVPIGDPIQGATLLLVGGELIIEGSCVANGYVNAPPGGFVLDKETRRYITGDRAELRDDRLFFTGRTDEQVKVHGVRLDLGEVESVARRYSNGSPVVVIPYQGELVLIAQVDGKESLETIRSGVEESLPRYAVPAAWFFVPGMPITSHGKIDKKALSDRLETFRGVISLKMQDEIQLLVERVWRDLTGCHDVSDAADFFQIGGHSIAAIRLAGRLTAELGLKVPVALVFDHPTLSSYVAELRGMVPLRQHAGDAYPIDAVQMSILSADTMSGEEGLYTVVDAKRIEGKVDWGRLRRAVIDTLSSHDVFSAKLVQRDSGDVVIQIVGQPDLEQMVTREIVTGHSVRECEAEAIAKLSASRKTSIDPFSFPSSAVHLFEYSPDVSGGEAIGCIAIVSHHVFVDEHAMVVFWNEVIGRYDGAALADPPSYLDWVRSRSANKEELQSQRAAEAVARNIGVVGAPTSPGWKQFDERDPSGAILNITPEEQLGISRLAFDLAVSTQVVLVSISARAVAAALGYEGVLFHLPVTARKFESDFETIGSFVSSLPVSFRSAPGARLEEDVAMWQRNIRFSLENQGFNPVALSTIMASSSPEHRDTVKVSISIETASSIGGAELALHPIAVTQGPLKYDVAIIIPGDMAARPVVDVRSKSIPASHLLDLIRSELLQMQARVDWSGDEGVESRIRADLLSFVRDISGAVGQGNSDIMSLGLQSIDLTKVIWRIKNRYGVRMKLSELLALSTVNDISADIRRRSPKISQSGAM